MLRKFNYTGRKKIERSRITIDVSRDPDGVRTFTASLNLSDLGLPGEASLHVEAYYDTSYMRFSFGTLNRPTVPAVRRLVEIDRVDIPLFRVKVVDRGGAVGQLLAEADRIAPQQVEPSNVRRICLLPVAYRDLGPEIWRLKISDRPILEVNNKIRNIEDGIADLIVRDQEFFSLVYPSVIRQILTHILVIEAFDPTDQDESSWPVQWLKFIRRMHPVPPTRVEQDDESSRQAALDWIDDAVNAFCEAHTIADRLGSTRMPEGNP